MSWWPTLALILLTVVLAAPSPAGAADRTWKFMGFGQDEMRLPTTPQSGDKFSQAMAVGDFDGDGLGDIAIGSPGEGNGYAFSWNWEGATLDFKRPGFYFYWIQGLLTAWTENRQGMVQVVYGSGGTHTFTLRDVAEWIGPDEEDWTRLKESTSSQFGLYLAAGDFNGDGYDDLAAYESNNVVVLRGTRAGIYPPPAIRRLGADAYVQGEVLTRDSWWMNTSVVGSKIGRGLCAVDFNHDGIDDLAVGCVDSDDDDVQTPCGVLIAEGRGDKGPYKHLFTTQVGFIVGSGDRFVSMTSGDFDGDGFDDLAVGNHGDHYDYGNIGVVFGGVEGIDLERLVTFNQGTIRLGYDQNGMGYAVAAGDFDGDGFDDLAAGCPWEDLHEGAAVLVYGSGGSAPTWDAPGGIAAARSGLFADNIGGNREEDDRFGYAMAGADFDVDGYGDLAIGVPGEAVNGVWEVGFVYVIFGGPGALDIRNALGKRQDWFQSSIGWNNYYDDDFGSSLAAGDLAGHTSPNRGGTGAELVIGVPSENLRSESDSGYLHVCAWADPPGSPSLTFSAMRAPAYGSARVSGRLTGINGYEMLNRTVAIQYLEDGEWWTGASVQTDVNGSFSATMPATVRTTYRAYYDGGFYDTVADYLEQTSASVTVLPRVRLTAGTNWTTLRSGRRYAAWGSIEPLHLRSDADYANKVVLKAWKKAKDGRYHYVRSFKATYVVYGAAKTKYQAAVKFTPGQWRVQAYHAKDERNAATSGRYDFFTVK